MSETVELRALRRELLVIARRIEGALRVLRSPSVYEPELPEASAEFLRAFAVNMREARLRAKLTQRSLAIRAGLSLSYVSLLERAGRNPKLTQIVALGRVLGVPPGSLLDGTKAAVRRRK